MTPARDKVVVVFSHHKRGGGKPLDSLWFSRDELKRRHGVELRFPWTGSPLSKTLRELWRADYVLFDGVWSAVLWHGPALLLAALLLGKRLVYYWHETDWHIRDRWPYDRSVRRSGHRGKQYLRRLPMYLALRWQRFLHLHVTEHGCRLLREVAGVRADRIRLLRNMSRSGQFENLPVPGDYLPGRIVACGHVKTNKRPDLFVEMARRLADDPAYSFQWVGRIDPGFDVDALVGGGELARRVHFSGWTDAPYLEIARANVFVHTSEFEAMPKVLMEALALGKPVVAFAVGGIPELLGEHGRTVPFGDVDALVDAVRASLPEMDDDQQRRRRAWYDAEFTEHAFADRFARILANA